MTPLHLLSTCNVPVGTHFGVWHGNSFTTDKATFALSRTCSGNCSAVIVNDEHGIRLYNIYDILFARAKFKLFGFKEGVYEGHADDRMCWIEDEDGEIFKRIDLKECAQKIVKPVKVIVIHRFPNTWIYRKDHI